MRTALELKKAAEDAGWVGDPLADEIMLKLAQLSVFEEAPRVEIKKPESRYVKKESL